MLVIKEYKYYYILIILAIIFSTIDMTLVYFPLILLIIGNHYLNYSINIDWLRKINLLKYKYLIALLYIVHCVSFLTLNLPILLKDSFKDTFTLTTSFFIVFILNLTVIPILNYYSLKHKFKNKSFLVLLLFFFSNINILSFLFTIPLNDKNHEKLP